MKKLSDDTQAISGEVSHSLDRSAPNLASRKAFGQDYKEFSITSNTCIAQVLDLAAFIANAIMLHKVN